jgi:hypothetical protein
MKVFIEIDSMKGLLVSAEGGKATVVVGAHIER